MTRLLAEQVRAGRAKDGFLVNAIIQAAEDTTRLLQDVQDVNVSSKGYDDGLVSATIASLGPDHVLTFLTKITDRCMKRLREASSNSLQVALVAAASIGSIPGIELLIDRGAEVNGVTTIFGIPLHAATFGGHIPAMKFLLDKGADPNSEELQKRRTPLHCAAVSGNEAAASLLLNVGAITNPMDIHEQTPLFLAVTQGHTNVTALLLAQESVNRDPVSGDSDISALLYAAERNNVGVVKQLLEQPAGIDVNREDPDFHYPPLSKAAESGYESMVELLLSHPDVDVNLSTMGKTPLECACEAGQANTVKLLLACPRVDKNIRYGTGFTPLITAALSGHEDVVKELLAYEEVEVNLRTTEVPDWDGFSALGSAASHGQEEAVKVLLEDPRVEIDNREGLGLTPLMLAAGSWSEQIVEMLLARNVDVNARSHSWATPLFRAADEGDEIMVTRLLNHPEVDVNAPNNTGETPLMMAADKGHVEIVRLLLKHPQIQVHISDDDEVSALLFAASEGSIEVVELLLERSEGAEPTEAHLREALDEAQESGAEQVVQLLSSKLNSLRFSEH